MTTSLTHGKTEDRSLSAILTAMLLAPRAVLPSAANGKPPLPSNALAASRRGSVVGGKADPMGALVVINECDLYDGCHEEDVNAPYHLLIARNKHIAQGIARRNDRPLPQLVRSETRAQGRADLAELRVITDPTDVAVLQQTFRDVNAHIHALVAVRDGIARDLAALLEAHAPRSSAACHMVLS